MLVLLNCKRQETNWGGCGFNSLGHCCLKRSPTQQNIKINKCAELRLTPIWSQALIFPAHEDWPRASTQLIHLLLLPALSVPPCVVSWWEGTERPTGEQRWRHLADITLKCEEMLQCDHDSSVDPSTVQAQWYRENSLIMWCGSLWKRRFKAWHFGGMKGSASPQHSVSHQERMVVHGSSCFISK